MNVRAVRGGADDDIAPHRFCECGLVAALDQRQDAAAEARTHDSGAKASLDPPRLLDQRVDVWSGDFEVVAQALVGFLQQHAQSFESPRFQRIDKGMDSSNLALEMTPALRVARFGLATALVVRRVGERAMLARIDDGDYQLIGERHRLIFEGRAVQQQSVAAPAEGGGELIHHADMHAGSALLSSLACARGLGAVHLGMEPDRNGDEQGR